MSCSTRVGRKHPVIVRRAALRLTSRVECGCFCTTPGHNYIPLAHARVDVLNFGVLAPQLVPAKPRINAVRAMTFNSLVGLFLNRCWCSTEIPLEEVTSVVGLFGCLADVFRPCTVLVESHSKVLCCVSHLQYICPWMLYWAMIGDGFRTCDS